MPATVEVGVFTAVALEVLENGFEAVLVLEKSDVEIENPAFHGGEDKKYQMVPYGLLLIVVVVVVVVSGKQI